MSCDTASQSSCNQPLGLLELRSIRAIALSPMSATIVITNTAPTAHTAFCRPGRSLNTAHSVGSASDVRGTGLTSLEAGFSRWARITGPHDGHIGSNSSPEF